MDSPIEGLTLPCPVDGDQEWQGDVYCSGCKKIYLCTGVEETGEFNDKGEAKKKYIYPESPSKGVCECGKRLFGGTNFTARPMCHLCAVRVTTRQAAERGEIVWKKTPDDDPVEQDEADPLGDGSHRLDVTKLRDEYFWEIDMGPESIRAQGECETREEAREMAAKVYVTLVKLTNEDD